MPGTKRSNETALTAKGGTPAERRMRVMDAIRKARGKVPPGVVLIDFREMTEGEKKFAATLEDKGRECLSGRRPVA